jgi:hypothetical protein
LFVAQFAEAEIVQRQLPAGKSKMLSLLCKLALNNYRENCIDCVHLVRDSDDLPRAMSLVLEQSASMAKL